MHELRAGEEQGECVAHGAGAAHASTKPALAKGPRAAAVTAESSAWQSLAVKVQVQSTRRISPSRPIHSLAWSGQPLGCGAVQSACPRSAMAWITSSGRRTPAARLAAST
jgi:hypothetical protein